MMATKAEGMAGGTPAFEHEALRQVAGETWLLALAPSDRSAALVPVHARRDAARHRYGDRPAQGVSATRYGDWEYLGRCTDF